VVEGDAGAHGDAFEGVVGDVAGDADLVGDEAADVVARSGGRLFSSPVIIPFSLVFPRGRYAVVMPVRLMFMLRLHLVHSSFT
jgi:hypothetical protein